MKPNPFLHRAFIAYLLSALLVCLLMSGCRLFDHVKSTEHHTIRKDSVVHIHHQQDFDSTVERIIKGKTVESKGLTMDDLKRFAEILKSHKDTVIKVATADGKSNMSIHVHPDGRFNIDSRALDSLVKHYHSVRSVSESDTMKVKGAQTDVHKENKIEGGISNAQIWTIIGVLLAGVLAFTGLALRKKNII